MNININQINNMRSDLGIKELKEYPAIPYPESFLEDNTMDIEIDNEDIDSISILFNYIIDSSFKAIAFYPKYLRFFCNINNGELK